MKIPTTDNRFQAAVAICAALTRAGHRALLAGGCVRDFLLNILPKDYDIATSARPDEVATLFRKTFAVGASFGVQVVSLPEGMFEVSTFRADGQYLDGRRPTHVTYTDAQEDALRRDFTINGLFFDPATNTVLDYVGGQEDLAHKIIRTVGEPHKRFQEDHLRLLRAIRFAARLEYCIESDTFAAIRETAPLILTTSAERIRDEILKMLTEGNARRAIELLDEAELLNHVLPEISAMKGVEQPPQFHPEGDVYQHTLLALEQLDAPSETLAMAVLLHDVGKPATQTFEDRIRFNYHDKRGGHLAATICRRLHMPREQTEQIKWLVENHMRVSAAPGMRESKLKRFVREPAFPELLELCRIDCLASHGQLDNILWLRRFIDELPTEQLKPPRLVNGNDLIAMGYPPSPLFTEILNAIEDAQLEGSITSQENARTFITTHWPPKS